MTEQQFEKRKERVEKETWIISRTDEGFRVYSPAYPTRSYIVSGSPEAPTCTCPDFQHHEGDLAWRCKHILAVLSQLNKGKTQPEQPDPYDREERLAIQSEAAHADKQQKQPQNNSASQMLIKRSISPDGRIDSLSVEFSCPVDQAPVGEIKSRAERMLKLQSEIVGRFLQHNGPRKNKATHSGNDSDGAMNGQMMNVGGLDGKWGRRLFINVRADGKTLKLFGSRKQLAEHVRAAGFPDYAGHIEENAVLHLPCRVITEPSENGKYLNIVRVLPARASQGEGRERW